MRCRHAIPDFARQRATWLLWLALLLPLAQLAGLVHGQTHMARAVAEAAQGGTPASVDVEAAACDLCLLAGNALLSAPPAASTGASFHGFATQAPRSALPDGEQPAAPRRHYAARAPPLLTC